jgi:hypothetical protein
MRFQSIQFSAAVLSAILLLSSFAHAANLDLSNLNTSNLHATIINDDALRTLLERPLHRLQTANYRATGRLVRVEENGTRTSYKLSIKARGLPGVLRVFVEIASPANVRTHILLQMRAAGQTTIQIAHPGDTTPTTLPFDQWNQDLGPGFSYEDFLESQYFWKNQTLLDAEKCGERDCDVIKSTPGESDRTHYSEIRTWLDKTIGFPVFVQKTMKGTGVVREYTYYGLRQNRGVWSASQVEAKVRGQAGSTLLIIERGSANAKLDDSEFNPVQLTQF